jgi:YbbR domain-containing protein
MVVDNRVDYVVLRVTGPRTLVSTLDSDDLKLSLDLHGAKAGTASYPLNLSSFHIPRGVTVARITPPVIHLRLDPVISRELPVTVRFTGKPAAGQRVGQTLISPDRVTVRGPVEEVRRMTTIETIPVDLDEGRAIAKRTVRLSTDGKPLALLPDQVQVSVTFDEEEATKEAGPIELRAKEYKGSYLVRPKATKIKITGAKSVVDKLQLTPEIVHLDLKGLAVGEHMVPLSVDLPAGVRLVEPSPAVVRVRITKAAP